MNVIFIRRIEPVVETLLHRRTEVCLTGIVRNVQRTCTFASNLQLAFASHELTVVYEARFITYTSSTRDLSSFASEVDLLLILILPETLKVYLTGTVTVATWQNDLSSTGDAHLLVIYH